jgi:hypothetical protein
MTEIPKPTDERSVFITHHTPEMDSVSVEQFSNISKELKKMGFSEHRFDVRWKAFSPTRDTRNESQIKHAADLARVAHIQGLEPIVILSTPPTWAYRGKSKEQIQTAFTEYASSVKTNFDAAGVSIKSVQILNELNNPVYTPKKLINEIPAFTSTVKQIFGSDTDVSATMVIAKPWANVEPFMEKHKAALSSLSSVGLDFYPGAYQFNKNMLKPKSGLTVSRQALEAIASGGTKNIRPDFLALLENQLTDIHEFSNALTKTALLFPNAHIDVGEFGFPSLEPLQRKNPKHETLQKIAVEKITNAMIPVLDRHKVRKIGFYELFDDKEFGVLNWGILNDQGDPKKILPHMPEIISLLKGTSTR